MTWFKKLWSALSKWWNKKNPPEPVPIPPPEPVVPPVDPVTPVGELVDPPLTEKEVKGAKDGYEEECGTQAHFGLIFRGHTIRPSISEYWILSSPWYYSSEDGKNDTRIRQVENDIVCPDVVYRGVVFHCRGWCKDEPGKHDMNPKLDFVGDRAPRGTKHAIVECRKVV